MGPGERVAVYPNHTGEACAGTGRVVAVDPPWCRVELEGNPARRIWVHEQNIITLRGGDVR